MAPFVTMLVALFALVVQPVISASNPLVAIGSHDAAHMNDSEDTVFVIRASPFVVKAGLALVLSLMVYAVFSCGSAWGKYRLNRWLDSCDTNLTHAWFTAKGTACHISADCSHLYVGGQFKKNLDKADICNECLRCYAKKHKKYS